MHTYSQLNHLYASFIHLWSTHKSGWPFLKYDDDESFSYPYAVTFCNAEQAEPDKNLTLLQEEDEGGRSHNINLFIPLIVVHTKSTLTFPLTVTNH